MTTLNGFEFAVLFLSSCFVSFICLESGLQKRVERVISTFRSRYMLSVLVCGCGYVHRLINSILDICNRLMASGHSTEVHCDTVIICSTQSHLTRRILIAQKAIASHRNAVEMMKHVEINDDQFQLILIWKNKHLNFSNQQDQFENLAAHTHKGIDFLDKYGGFVRDRCAIEVEYAAKLR